MKKYKTIEIYIDETMEDSKQCANEIIDEVMTHYYVSDGTVKIEEIEEEKQWNIGIFTSSIICSKCGNIIDIFPEDTTVNCGNCGSKIDLYINYKLPKSHN